MARAVLTGSALRETKLSGAFLSGADLTWGNLIDADMTGARLRGADMTRADLTGADLAGADLHGAMLIDTNLTGAKGLTQDQLEHSRGTKKTRLPDGLDPPMHWNYLEAVGEALAEDEVRRASGERG